jgi:hypothetical protein
MGKVIALFVLVGGGFLLRAIMYNNSSMGLFGGIMLAIGIALLIAEIRKIR